MRTATLIVAAVSGLALAAPAEAQQTRGANYPAPAAMVPAAPVTVVPATAVPAAHAPHRPNWRPGTPRPGGWQPARPPQGGWKPGHPRPGSWTPGTPRPGNWQPARPGRWGQRIDGRWYAGWRAPGGWGAYRRPVRGWTLPSYWIGVGFWINDWSSWGLSRPAAGYDWVRYYDDAVLIDRRGKVWDSVSGLDWDRDGHGYDYDDDDGYYADRDRDDRDDRERGADYDAPGYDERDYDRDARHGDRYAYRGEHGYRGYARRPMVCVANCYGGYYSAPASTTVVIQSAPVVTTTTTVTEEYVTYGARKVVRRAPTKKLYRAPVKSKNCYCR
jgi:Ni/Co efflux regulator RcnB